MADTSMVDLVALIERYAPVRFGKARGREEGRTRKSSCPWCGGKDRFAVFVNAVPQHYHCGINKGAGCGAHGDAITFLREWEQMGYFEACQELDVDPGSEYTGPRHRNDIKKHAAPSDIWQTRAIAFCKEAKAVLQSDKGLFARQWLYKRGFTDATIESAGLGLCLGEGYQPASEWGTKEDVWIACGIVIPWVIEGQMWYVNIRRRDRDIEADIARGERHPPKYIGIHGGSEGLYGFDTIVPGKPLMICEGEFDRLSLLQATNYRIAVVATGGVGKATGDKWIRTVSEASPILVTFDYDANKAGDIGSEAWKKKANARIEC